jgi:hypothetical protein
MAFRGLSLIDVLIGTALILVIFLSMFAAFKASIGLNALAKARASATALANQQVEYIRSLTYAEVGTVGGIPAGVVPEYATSTVNDLTYVTRTFVQYIDDATDGLEDDDENGVFTDYKKIKVQVLYTVNGKNYTVDLSSVRSPRGVETTENGGTLKIKAIDSLGATVSSAQVHIQNSSTNPPIDVTTFTNTNGVVFLPGAPTTTGYRITVSKSGYSTAETYDQDASNVNPNPGHLTVAEGATTQGTFAIDVLSSLRVRTFSPLEEFIFSDTFLDDLGISTSTAVSVSGGELTLEGSPGSYASSGEAHSVNIAPTYLAAWNVLYATTTKPAGTNILFRVYKVSGATETLVPDTYLPGNSTGFAATPIDLSGIPVLSYPELRIGAVLGSVDPDATPAIESWEVRYDRGPVPLPAVPFSGNGAKTIGETSLGAPIYKKTFSNMTDGNGEYVLSDMEWDGYDFSILNYDLVEACTPLPFSLLPNTSNTLDFILGDETSHNLRVVVRDNSNALLSGATVTLSRSGFSEEVDSSLCGQAYFGGIGTHSDYTISVSKAGHTFTPVTGVTVSGATVVSVTAD